MGITVCSIAGTNFAPYVKLLGPKGLNIPFAILTDFDPKGSEASQEDDDPQAEYITDSYGKSRVINHIMEALLPPKRWEELTADQLLKLAPRCGVFLNEFTFEVDVFNAGAEEHFQKTAEELSTNKKMHARFKTLSEYPASLDEKQFLKDIDSIGKGRFAQRLASTLRAADANVCPPYIKDALEYMREKLR